MTSSPIRVLMVSTSYPMNARDWRGRFVYDISAGLARRGDISLSVWAPPGDLPRGARYAAGDSAAWLDALQRRGGIAQALRRGDMVSVVRLLSALRRGYRREAPYCDLIHVNWLQNLLPLAGTDIPVVVGVLGRDFGLLRLPGMQAAIRRVLRQRPAIIAPNAAWMRPTLEQAFGDIAEIRTIPFAIDPGWLKVDRIVPTHGPAHWLLVTRITRAKIGKLFEWGEGLFGVSRQLHLIGPLQEAVEMPPWVSYEGPVDHQTLRENWYPLATGFITLSDHDEGLPQALLEAMSSGVPAVVSPLPAHLGIVVHDETGWVAGSRGSFEEGLRRIEDSREGQRLGSAGRDRVLQELGTWDDCADRIVAAYRDLLS